MNSVFRSHSRRNGVLLAAAFCVAGGMLCRAVTSGTEVSERRLSLMRKLVQAELARLGPDAEAEAVARNVLPEFFRQEPDCPSGLVLADPVTEEECREEARQIQRELVARKFPDLDLAALEKEAAEKYPVYKEGDIVEVEFQPNPARRERVRGPFESRTTNVIVIGRHQIRVADIAAVKGNEKLLLMLDADRSLQLRKAYVEEKVNKYNAEKEAYADAVRAAARRERYLAGARENEKRGYTFLDDGWYKARDAVLKVVEAEKTALAAERKRQAEQAAAAAQQEAEALAAAGTAAAQLGSAAPGGDPQAELAEFTARVEAAQKKSQEEPPGEKAAEEKPEEEKPAEAAPGEPQVAAAEEVPQPATAPAPRPPPAAETPEEGGGVSWVLVALVVLVVLGGAAGLAYSAVRSRRSRDLRRFFQPKGTVERNFWALAEADPEHFKYVAYRFPTLEEARAALLRLSYITTGPDNQLRSTREVEFGFYPHEDKWVCFVGGTELSYALWREASAVWPELPNAEYFRVSTAPEVKLEVPDIEAMLRDEALKIEHVENRQGEGEDYGQYYVYRAPDKRSALEFLKRASVSEAGVHVVVQTPEGTWGKDETGIYEEEPSAPADGAES